MGINRRTDVFVGIDGTGTADNQAYAKTFMHSHVHNMSRKGWASSLYKRGPTLAGTETERLSHLVAGWVGEQSKRFPDMRLFLAGYSRGGAAVIAGANLLARFTPAIPVYGLFLFDAVNRTYNVSETTIPKTVKFTFHALRSPGAWSRPEFGNCGHNPTGGGRYIYRHFYATHGGLGGTPWPQGDNEPSDYISEGNIYEELAGIVLQGGLNAPGYLRRTNVTYAQDREGAKATGNWMEQMFQFIV